MTSASDTFRGSPTGSDMAPLRAHSGWIIALGIVYIVAGIIALGSVVTATTPLAGEVQTGTVKPYVDFSALDLVGVVVEPPRTDPRDALLSSPVPTVTVTATVTATPSVASSGAASGGPDPSASHSLSLSRSTKTSTGSASSKASSAPPAKANQPSSVATTSKPVVTPPANPTPTPPTPAGSPSG